MQASMPDASRGFQQVAWSWQLTRSAACSSLLALHPQCSVPAGCVSSGCLGREASFLPVLQTSNTFWDYSAPWWSPGCSPSPALQGRCVLPVTGCPSDFSQALGMGLQPFAPKGLLGQCWPLPCSLGSPVLSHNSCKFWDWGGSCFWGQLFVECQTSLSFLQVQVCGRKSRAPKMGRKRGRGKRWQA